MSEVNKLECIGLYVMPFPSVCELLANVLSEDGISYCTQHTQIFAAEKEWNSSLSMHIEKGINFLPLHFYFREVLSR